MGRRAHPGISRRAWLSAAASLGVVGLGCSRTTTLSVYNWASYLAPELAERFAKREAKLRVAQEEYLSEAELDAKLRAGVRYDLAVPTDYLLDALQRDGLLLELDPLPAGTEHLSPEFPVWRAPDERGGGAYAIPYLWGTTGIGYDSEKVETPTSWNAMFDERYAGHISLLDSGHDVLDQALLASGMSMNSTDEQEIRGRVWPRVHEQKQLLRDYDSEPAEALLSGDTWIAQIDIGDLLRAQAKRPSLRFAIPDEGAARWTDYLVILANAPHPKLARAFIEFMLEPDHAALNANTLRFATPNGSALERGLIADAEHAQLYPSEEVRGRLFTSKNWDGAGKELVDELWRELRGIS